jgi:hypothetical protein
MAFQSIMLCRRRIAVEKFLSQKYYQSLRNCMNLQSQVYFSISHLAVTVSEDKVGNIQFRLLSQRLSQVVPRKERSEKLIGEGNASGCLSQRTGRVGTSIH